MTNFGMIGTHQIILLQRTPKLPHRCNDHSHVVVGFAGQRSVMEYSRVLQATERSWSTLEEQTSRVLINTNGNILPICNRICNGSTRKVSSGAAHVHAFR